MCYPPDDPMSWREIALMVAILAAFAFGPALIDRLAGCF